MTTVHAPSANRLLGLLPDEDRLRLLSHLEYIDLPTGTILHEPGVVLAHVYFPTDGIVSMLKLLADGSSAEIALVGNDGMIGVALFMGGGVSLSRAIVQSAGHAYRLSGDRLKEEFQRNEVLHDLLLRYMQSLITQMAQTAVCNRHHTIDQQLCRLLLMMLERLQAPELELTQEVIAGMLGVRRERVTEAAGKLQRHAIISYRRGRIRILNPAKLHVFACECYAAVKREADRLAN